MTINRKTDALIVVDAQNDFLPGGALAVKDGDQIINPIVEMASKFDTVILTRDYHPQGHISFASTHKQTPFAPFVLPDGRKQMMWPDHCVAGSPGSEIPAIIAKLPNVRMILSKGTRLDVDSYSGFFENETTYSTGIDTGLGDFLKRIGVKRIVVVGLAFDFCVAWTAKDGAKLGFETTIVTSGTRSVFPENDKETMFDLEKSGISIVPVL